MRERERKRGGEIEGEIDIYIWIKGEIRGLRERVRERDMESEGERVETPMSNGSD